MIILDQSIDLAGKIRMTCQLSNGETIALKFAEQPTQAELDNIEADYIAQHQSDHIAHETISIYDHIDVLKDFIAKIKATPTVTLAQYNTWLATKQWYEAAIIRFFVYRLAQAVATKKGYTLSNYTETVILGYLRDWIVATPGNEIAKTVIGNTYL